MHSPIIDNGICANTIFEGAIDPDGGMLEYSRLNDTALQAGSPMQYDWFKGVFLGDRKYPELNKEIKINALAEKYYVVPITMGLLK